MNFGTEVTKGLATSDWEGEAADAAAQKFRKVQEQIQAAADESRRVHNVMRQGLEDFRAARKALEDIETELEGHPHLRLNKHDGSVYLDLTTAEDDNVAALNKTYQETFAYYRDRTNSAIERAEQADSALAHALTTDVNGADRGFNDKAYDTLAQARAESAKDLKAALDLAGLEQGTMTSDQLSRLALVMARHSQDPEFAEQFATRLGPEKTLKLWYNATHPHNVLHPDTDIDEKVWWKSAKSLQESLGTTLATASHSDSPEMRAWKDEIIRTGSERLNTGGTTHPYGFQVMSNLMRSGTYDARFLNSYGDKLLAWDEKNNTKDGFAYWSNTADVDSLNLIGRRDDNGQDPVTGFLEGLGHNPKAATEFFEPPAGTGSASDVNSHLEYLTQERNWIFDGNTAGTPRDLPGHEALGHALTAATTGYAWDEEELLGKDPEIFGDGGGRRTAATADVMEQVVGIYGGEEGPELLHDQPGMAAALGAMGGAYVDDLNFAVSGTGGHIANDEAFPAAYRGRAEFGRTGAIDFLSVLGQNEVSHGIMNQAEHLYTLDRFAQHPPSESADNYANGRRALLTEAEVRGILDHSRAAQIEATYAHDSTKAQQAFQDSSNWTRVGYSGAAPALSAGIISGVGKAGPWGMIVPIVMGAGTEFAKVFHNDAVFGGPELPAPVDTREFFIRGEESLGATAAQYLEGHSSEADATGNLSDDLKNNYGTGAQEGAQRGRKPYTG
ncbi:hypothetical protein HW130_34550 [Streptomyces sp. PKU-EA00015]|uniref:DUF6571 family protein n=1 Tax=Streptomyces sp. PKU-EA00015 TaxID=2748326 RepID=UPI0015A02FDA|nr:DUF6571 family protein [Streptomyces sp. PKU-EA00015]NWF31288.1 hypothetical protein [Streptomyces sp. PKU-EA00015]